MDCLVLEDIDDSGYFDLDANFKSSDLYVVGQLLTKQTNLLNISNRKAIDMHSLQYTFNESLF